MSSPLDAFNIPPVCGGVSAPNGWRATAGPPITARSPIDGRILATVSTAEPADVQAVIAGAESAFRSWRLVPAPRRGDLVRLLNLRLRQRKADLAAMISLEVGKIPSEALGEVQEMADMCAFAVGLSRQLYGLTMPSERPGHRLLEQWLPLGPVGIITAFNFPTAVWAWNAALALICGDPVIWKPSEKAPLCAIAVHQVVQDALRDFADAPDGLINVVIGNGPTAGAALAASPKLPLISATGSVSMGRAVGAVVAQRLGRSLLELGGNNAAVVTPSADLELAVRAIVFAAAGTAGQRCTTLRRLIVHRSIKAGLVQRILTVYGRLRIGDPLSPGVLVGPLIDEAAALAMRDALAAAAAQGGQIHGGQRINQGVPAGGAYVAPALVEISPDAPILQQETFAPILFVMEYETLEQAIAIHNAVPQGLASAIFTNDLREAEIFISAVGSDCGIVNVNTGPSGAEIGGAFGGEKATGGGREAGSDSWKAYMRRTTNTINASGQLPLAQGVSFEP